MRREKAIKLGKDWANKLCMHPYSEEEYYLGKPTGKDVCTVCGSILGKKSAVNFIQKKF
jgi:hypothetical protein